MLRQVYQPAGAVFIAAHNVLSQRQVQERLREYIIEEGRDCMYLYGFDIGGTKCAVILAKVEGDQVDFLERYEMKTLGDWKKVLDELSENALMIAKKYGLTTGTEGENCVICGGISCGGPLSPDRKWILSPPNLQGWDQVPVVEYLEEKLGIPVKMENDADAGALAEWKFGAGKGCQNMIFLTFGTGLGSGLILNGQLYRGSTGMAGEAGHIRMENEGPKGYGKVGSLEGFCSGGGISRLAGYFGTEGSAKELAERAEAGDERALAVYARCGAVFGRGLAILIDLLNPEKIVAGSVYARSHHLLDKTMYKELEKEALPMNRAACEIVPAALGERIGDYAAVVAAVNSLSIL